MAKKILHNLTTASPATVEKKLLRDSKRRLAKTDLGKLGELFKLQTKWQRKQTIAANKLAVVRIQIDALAHSMAATRVENQWEGKTHE